MNDVFPQKSPDASHTVALVHDSFFIRGGAERMNVEIAKILGADIFTAVLKPESYDLRAMGFAGRVTEIFPSFRRGMLGFVLMKFAFLLRCRPIGGYSAVIFSNEAVSARIWARNARKIYYAHSISRHLFDQKDEYARKVPPYFRPAFRVALSLLRWWYVRDLRAMDLILANSLKNADFLRELAPGVRVEVLYPPVNTGEFYPVGAGEDPDLAGSKTPRNPGKTMKSEADFEHRGEACPRTLSEERRNRQGVRVLPGFHAPYFLSYARLAHAKRIDAIVRAFLLIPEKRLKVVYGKNDPQLEEFRALAHGAENIEFVTLTDNAELPSIVRHAIATICVSKNEDFGMVAVESMASGVPVIAVAEGGYLETVIDGKTGILLPSDFSVSDLVAAVRQITPEFREALSENCVERAKKFSLDSFARELEKFTEGKLSVPGD